MVDKRKESGLDEDGFPDDPIPFPDDDDSDNNKHSSNHTSSTVHHDKDESDHYADVDENHETHEENNHEEVEDENEEDKVSKRSLLSKLIFPVSGAVVVGLGTFVAWQAGFIGGKGSDPVQNQVSISQPVTPVQGPRVPVANVTPNLPQPSAQSQPKPVNSGLTLPASNGNGELVLPASNGNTAMSSVAMPTSPVVIVQPIAVPQNVASMNSQNSQADIISNINNLVVEMQTANRNNAANNNVSGEIRGMREAVMTKFDVLSSQVINLSNRFDGMDSKVSSMDSRIVALEARYPTAKVVNVEVPLVVQGSSSNGRSPIKLNPPTPKSNTKITHNRQNNYGRSTPVAVSLSEYKLIGASRETALVETPQGMFQVKLGESLPNGAIAKGFRQDGDNWVLVTGSGDIRP